MNDARPGKAVEKMLLEALDAIVAGDMQPWIDMFTDDGVMEFPYAPPGYPPVLDGKKAIADYLEPYAETINLERVEVRGFYHADDVTVAEFTGYGVAVKTGNRFTLPYISVIRFEDGKIKHYRDYWDPLVGLRALGGLEELLAFGRNGADG